jgi:lipopolysaccharide export system permease protein
MVIAISLFITFHFVGIFGENSSEEDGLAPWLGAWLPSMIMFPLGFLLTKRATSDKGLFSLDNFLDGAKSFFRKLITFQKKVANKQKS